MPVWSAVVISIFLSTLEIAMILLLTFQLFRFPVKQYYKSMLMIGLVLAYTSIELREGFQLKGWDTIVQIVILYLSLRFIYRIGYFYALAMIVKGTVLFILLQTAASALLLKLNVYNLEDADSALNSGAYILQILSLVLALIVSYLMRRWNVGFTYVPFSPKEAVVYKGINRKILIFGIITFIVFVFSVIAVFLHNLTAFYITVLVMLVMFVLMLRLSYEKEYTDEEEILD